VHVPLLNNCPPACCLAPQVFQHTLHTNTGLELVTQPPAVTATAAGNGISETPPATGNGPTVAEDTSKPRTTSGRRNSVSSLPAHSARYSTIFTDYYTVLNSNGLMKVLGEPLSW
jgi:hypothetical protein